MKRFTKAVAIAMLISAIALLAGCAGNDSETRSTKGDMAAPTGVWGYVASPESASLELDEDQLAAQELVVKRVVAPEDSWVVVHIDMGGKPGARVGLAHVNKGETIDVKVPLEGVTSPSLLVALHADRARPEEFDFDMMKPAMSPDRPFFVNDKELAKAVKVRDFGVKAAEGEAAITVADQPGAGDSLVVQSVTAPTAAWVVVHKNDDGMPGARVGLLEIPAGTSTGLNVPIEGEDLGDSLLIAVHADRGVSGTFEFDMGNKIGSPDQPFFVDGEEVATKAFIK